MRRSCPELDPELETIVAVVAAAAAAHIRELIRPNTHQENLEMMASAGKRA